MKIISLIPFYCIEQDHGLKRKCRQQWIPDPSSQFKGKREAIQK